MRSEVHSSQCAFDQRFSFGGFGGQVESTDQNLEHPTNTIEGVVGRGRILKHRLNGASKPVPAGCLTEGSAYGSKVPIDIGDTFGFCSASWRNPGCNGAISNRRVYVTLPTRQYPLRFLASTTNVRRSYAEFCPGVIQGQKQIDNEFGRQHDRDAHEHNP